MNEAEEQRGQRIIQAFADKFPEYTKFIVPAYISKKFNSLYSIRTDLEHVISARAQLADIIQAEKDGVLSGDHQTVKTALWNSIVATYGKCFTGNDHGKTKLEMSQCFKNNPALLALHKKLMRIRHEYVSHRGSNEYDVSHVMLMYPNSEFSDDPRPRVQAVGLKEIWPSLSDLVEYDEVFISVMAHVKGRLAIEADKIPGEIGKLLETLPVEQRARLIFQ